MQVNTKDLLLKAQKEGYAVGAFNISNLETLIAIMAAAEAKKSPVILQIAEGSIEYAGLYYLASLAHQAAEMSDLPVAIHLDHGKSLDIAKDCINAGFSSVMLDASTLSLDQNINLTKQAVDLAHARGVSVEGEEGVLSENSKDFAKPGDVKKFVCETGVDFVAVTIGSSHGYHPDENLDLKRLEQIKKVVDIPLVLHGASAISDFQIREAIKLGVCKINIHTEIRMAFIEGVKEGLETYLHTDDHRKILKIAIKKMQKVVEKKIELFGCEGKF